MPLRPSGTLAVGGAVWRPCTSSAPSDVRAAGSGRKVVPDPVSFCGSLSLAAGLGGECGEEGIGEHGQGYMPMPPGTAVAATSSLTVVLVYDRAP